MLHVEVGPLQPVVGEVAAHAADQFAEGDAGLLEAATQGALAQVESPGDVVQGHLARRQPMRDHPRRGVRQRVPSYRANLLQQPVGIGAEHDPETVIRRRDTQGQRVRRQLDCIGALAEFDFAAEQAPTFGDYPSAGMRKLNRKRTELHAGHAP